MSAEGGGMSYRPPLCPVCLAPAEGLVYERRGSFELEPLTVAPRVCIVTNSRTSPGLTHPVGVLHFPPPEPVPLSPTFCREAGRDARKVWVWQGGEWLWRWLPWTVPAGGAVVAVMSGPCVGMPVTVPGPYTITALPLDDTYEPDPRDELEPHSVLDHEGPGVGL